MTGVLQAYFLSIFSLLEKDLFGPGINCPSHLLAVVEDFLRRQVHVKKNTSLKAVTL